MHRVNQMSREPFFSVVIPTRNRGQLLEHALQSVLEQDFDDYELIVSDNCSTDNTAEVIKRVAGNRARCVRPDRVLSMPDHWEFALTHASGRYVGYLSDDDAWTGRMLSRAAEVLTSTRAALVAVQSGLYYGANWLDHDLRNTAILTPHTGEVREHESQTTLRELYTSSKVIYEAPRMLNSFCDRRTMLRVKSVVERIFLISPDYSFPAFLLTEIPSWLYLDEPLHLQGVFAEGIGSTMVYNRGEPAREFIREFGDDRLLKRVRFKVPLVANYISEALLMAKERLPDKLADYDLDLEQYFLSCWADLATLEGSGVDVRHDRQEFQRTLDKQPEIIRAAVRRTTDRALNRNPFKAAARRLSNSSSLLRAFGSRLRSRNGESSPAAIVRGEDAGFNNILECARMLPAIVNQSRTAATI